MNRPVTKERLQKLGDKIDELSKRTGLTTDFIVELLVDSMKEVSDYAERTASATKNPESITKNRKNS